MFMRASSGIILFENAIKALKQVPHDTMVDIDMDIQNLSWEDEKLFNLRLVCMNIRQMISEREKLIDNYEDFKSGIDPNNSDHLWEP